MVRNGGFDCGEEEEFGRTDCEVGWMMGLGCYLSLGPCPQFGVDVPAIGPVSESLMLPSSSFFAPNGYNVEAVVLLDGFGRHERASVDVRQLSEGMRM